VPGGTRRENYRAAARAPRTNIPIDPAVARAAPAVTTVVGELLVEVLEVPLDVATVE